MKRNLFIILMTIFLFGTLPSKAQQGNYKYNNFGNTSILLSGNVTGSVNDLGLTYYNPARLALVESTGFAISAKAYEYNSVKLENIAGVDNKFGDSKFGGIPTMAGGTFNLFGTRFAISLISRSKININTNHKSPLRTSDLFPSFPGDEDYQIIIGLNTEVRDEWFGLTWAKNVTDKLSFGASLFASTYKYAGGSKLNYTIQAENDEVSFLQNNTDFSQESYGLFLRIGANYHMPKFDIGVNVNLPYLEVHQAGKFDYNKILVRWGTQSDQFYDYAFKDLNSRRSEPLGISIGSGISFGKNKLHLNIDYVGGLGSYRRIDIPIIDIGETEPKEIFFNEKRRPVINFGVGGEFYLSDNFISYISISTDYNSFESSANIFDLSTSGAKNVDLGMDYLHLGFGINWKIGGSNIIIGTTYAESKNEFVNPFYPIGEGNEEPIDQISKLNSSRWQFIVGLEIPFIDSKLKKVKGKND